MTLAFRASLTAGWARVVGRACARKQKQSPSGTLPLENDGNQVVVRIVRVLTRSPAAKAAGIGR